MHHDRPTHTQHVPESVRVVKPHELTSGDIDLTATAGGNRRGGLLSDAVNAVRRSLFGRVNPPKRDEAP